MNAWQPIATAPLDRTLILAIYQENGQLVYALSHYRHNRDGSEGWYDGTERADKAPLFWMALHELPEVQP